MNNIPSFETEEETKAWEKGYDAGLKAMGIYRRLSKGAALAIEAISCEWYADCDMPKMDRLIHRIMGWEFRIKRELGIQNPLSTPQQQ